MYIRELIKGCERGIVLAVGFEEYLFQYLTGGTHGNWLFPDLEVCIFCSPPYSIYLHWLLW